MIYPMRMLKINELPEVLFPTFGHHPNYIVPELERIKEGERRSLKSVSRLNTQHTMSRGTFASKRKFYTATPQKQSQKLKENFMRPVLTECSFEFDRPTTKNDTQKSTMIKSSSHNRSKSIYMCQSRLLDQVSIHSKEKNSKKNVRLNLRIHSNSNFVI